MNKLWSGVLHAVKYCAAVLIIIIIFMPGSHDACLGISLFLLLCADFVDVFTKYKETGRRSYLVSAIVSGTCIIVLAVVACVVLLI